MTDEHSAEHAGDDAEAALDAARQRRVELKRAVSEVEIAAAGAAADPTWRDDLRVALDGLLEAFDHHVDEVEGHDGLLDEMVLKAPRLSKRADRLRDEHPELRSQIVDVTGIVAASDVDEVRSRALDVLVAIARHRQAGADLVYDAYNVDIGGE